MQIKIWMKAAWSVFQSQCSWRSRSYLSGSGILYGALSNCIEHFCSFPSPWAYLHAAWLLQVGGSYGLCKHTLLFILHVKWHLPFRYCTDRRVLDLIVCDTCTVVVCFTTWVVQSVLKTLWLLLNIWLLSRTHVLSLSSASCWAWRRCMAVAEQDSQWQLGPMIQKNCLHINENKFRYLH